MGESQGNGGDIQKISNDIAVCHYRENYVFLSFFGGNIEESTPAVDNVNRLAKDYWGNGLFYKNQPNRQFNSSVERALRDTPLTSAGRVAIENAAREDLKWLRNIGAEVTVNVSFPGLNKVRIDVRTIYSDGKRRLTILAFNKRGFGNGDFSPIDFSDDFF